MKHSILPPSSAARRVACPGSRALEEKYPEDEESPHAREGDAAHWVASQVLRECATFPEFAPNGELITAEMLEGAELYYDAIATVLNKIYGMYDHTQLRIEEQIDISTIHPDCWGTPDCWLYHAPDLYIWDYKFGHGIVEVCENWQLIEYAAGIMDHLGIDGIKDQHTYVTFTIVQPRGYDRLGAVRQWRIKASSLRSYFNILRNAENEALNPYSKCHPSPECNYCRGRHACETLQRSALSAVDLSTLNVPLELEPADIGRELRYLQRAYELLEARLSGLSEQALSLIKKGNRVPGYLAEASKGRERWKKSTEEIQALGELFGFNLLKSPEAITPRQAIKAGVPEELVKSYTETQHGALKLIPEDANKIRRIFGDNK
jgi:Protein of unknown function (DUF2800)